MSQKANTAYHKGTTSINKTGDLSPLDLTTYRRYFTLDVDDNQSIAQLEADYITRGLGDNIYFRVVSAHGYILGNDFIRVPKDTIILACGDEGHMVFDYIREASKSFRPASMGYTLLFIQYLNFLASVSYTSIDKNLVQENWRFFRHSVQHYWSLLAPENNNWPRTMFEIIPYFEGDIIPDMHLDFLDEKEPRGIYEWREFKDRMKGSVDDVRNYMVRNVRSILSYLSPTLTSTFGEILDKICEATSGTNKFRIIFTKTCRDVSSPYIDLTLLPGHRTLFKNVLNNLNTLQSLESSEAVLNEFSLQRYGFGLEILKSPQTKQILETLKTLFDRSFGGKTYAEIKKKDIRELVLKILFYKKYCFTNTTEVYVSRHKKNQIVLYEDAHNLAEKIYRNPYEKRFLNKYIPVRDIFGVPYYFDLSEQFPGQEFFGQPPSSQKLFKLPKDQMYYYPDNRHGKMLSSLFDKDNRRSLDISRIRKEKFMFSKPVRGHIFNMWAKVAEPLVHKSVWPDFKTVMELAFVKARPLCELQQNFPSFFDFLANYKLFLLQWGADNVSKTLYWVNINKGKINTLEPQPKPWLSQILADRQTYLSSTTKQTVTWTFLRRGLSVAYLTPLEYALCNFYLYGENENNPITLYNLVCRISTLDETKKSVVVNDIKYEDIAQTAKELSHITNLPPDSLNLMLTPDLLTTELSKLINKEIDISLAGFPLSVLTRLDLSPFAQDKVVSHIMSRLPSELIHEIKRDYLIGDYSSIFTVRHLLIGKLELLTENFFDTFNATDSVTFMRLFDFYFRNVFVKKKLFETVVPPYRHLETFNFFQLLLLEQELTRVMI